MADFTCRLAWLPLYAVGLFSTLLLIVDAELHVPGLLTRQFPFTRVREADINIGLTLSVHQSANGDDRCSVLMPTNVLWSWTMQFAVKQINTRHDLLPNITIGFVHVDDCFSALKCLEGSVYFVKDSCNGGTGSGNCSISDSSADSLFQSYDVVGIIGPLDSGTSVKVSPYLGTFQVPQLAIYATANALSDKSQYPYFMRLVPAESGQQHVLLEVISTYQFAVSSCS
jgi:Receptor family ligand binding region